MTELVNVLNNYSGYSSATDALHKGLTWSHKVTQQNLNNLKHAQNFDIIMQLTTYSYALYCCQKERDTIKQTNKSQTKSLGLYTHLHRCSEASNKEARVVFECDVAIKKRRNGRHITLLNALTAALYNSILITGCKPARRKTEGPCRRSI